MDTKALGIKVETLRLRGFLTSCGWHHQARARFSPGGLELPEHQALELTGHLTNMYVRAQVALSTDSVLGALVATLAPRALLREAAKDPGLTEKITRDVNDWLEEYGLAARALDPLLAVRTGSKAGQGNGPAMSALEVRWDQGEGDWARRLGDAARRRGGEQVYLVPRDIWRMLSMSGKYTLMPVGAVFDAAELAGALDIWTPDAGGMWADFGVANQVAKAL